MLVYGIGLNIGSLPGNIYTNIVLGATCDFIGVIIFPFMVNSRLGRKGACMFNLFIAAITIAGSSITAEFRPCNANGSVIDIMTTVLALVARVFINSNFSVIYQYCSELFPTPVRGNGVSIGSTVGKFGTACTPVFLALHEVVGWLPGIIFGGLCLSAFAGCWFLPETKGVPQLQTFEEAQKLYTGEIRGVDNSSFEK